MKKLLLFWLVLTLPLTAQADRLRIAAASDLRYALDDIAELYRAQHPDAPQLDIIYGSSGKLTTQILNGAPFELFFSADIAYPRKLHAERFTATEPEIYALGRIVIWSQSLDASELTLRDLARPEIRRIAIAQPSHAPYGARAREALESVGVWDQVKDKLVFGENIAQAAQMAASEAADVGIIALSLALFPELAQRGHHLIDAALHQPLTQGFVLTRRGRDNPAARDFANFMASAAARAIMRDYGFGLPKPSGE